MFIVQNQAGSLVEIQPGSTITSSGARHPWMITELWPDDELEAINVWRVSPAKVPDGKIVTGYTFVMGEDGPEQVLDLADAPAPDCVSAFQARSALRLAGLLDAVETAINSADEQTQDAWEYAVEFRRDSPTIASMAATLGLSDQEVDDLFTAAAQITA
ncbi:hypothetical protein GCM10007276_12400 [Agaricicola taiwanensis]|uniref:Uncharacterized protein n=1 Tax=Agaricicola taiwanensis TaxID=591372 RepID=A0A8J2YGN3_9RHOB|nr:hypothetical protein [Agaricicola taiwanensis]GGE36423.1 hypothetical protein GCM10007276_12400 [Agaricicola taiwanensis]